MTIVTRLLTVPVRRSEDDLNDGRVPARRARPTVQTSCRAFLIAGGFGADVREPSGIRVAHGHAPALSTWPVLVTVMV